MPKTSPPSATKSQNSTSVNLPNLNNRSQCHYTRKVSCLKPPAPCPPPTENHSRLTVKVHLQTTQVNLRLTLVWTTLDCSIQALGTIDSELILSKEFNWRKPTLLFLHQRPEGIEITCWQKTVRTRPIYQLRSPQLLMLSILPNWRTLSTREVSTPWITAQLMKTTLSTNLRDSAQQSSPNH